MALLMVSIAAGWMSPHGNAQERPRGQPALEGLFQLGLPDTRGAKWVMAHVMNMPIQFETILPREQGNLRGNAWMLREEPDGTMELIVNRSQRVRVARFDPAAAAAGKAPKAGLPMAQIQPADLEKDMATLAAAATKALQTSGGAEVLDEYRQTAAVQAAGQALLFLAHLQRQGREEYVGRVMPGVLAMTPTSEELVDAAVSLLANGRLAQLTDQWIADGDAKKFAQGVEKLAAEFSRGWKQREAALLLVQRARMPQPAPRADDPATSKMIALLSNLPEGGGFSTDR